MLELVSGRADVTRNHDKIERAFAAAFRVPSNALAQHEVSRQRHDHHTNRWLHAFHMRGVHDEGIVLEVSIPKEGVHRGIGGVLVREGRRVLLAHRGLLSGRPGIKAEVFRREYQGNWMPFRDGDRTSDAVLLGETSSPGILAKNVAAFVRDVAVFKGMLPAGPVTIPTGPWVAYYAPEFVGKKTMPARDAVTYESHHGAVVNALAARWAGLVEVAIDNRAERRGHDLLLIQGRRRALFEIKTDGASDDVLKGVGQLLVYGAALRATERWLILPEATIGRWRPSLKSLGIGVAGYCLERGDISFRALPHFN
jgi:hypothetical protein